jgi:hypothetical protein
VEKLYSQVRVAELSVQVIKEETLKGHATLEGGDAAKSGLAVFVMPRQKRS